MATKKKAAPAKAPERRPEDDLWSGRMVIAMTFVLAMVAIPMSPLSLLITKQSPKTEDRQSWTVGKEATIHLTVITADYDKLACADTTNVEGSHCQFLSEKEAFPQDPSAPLDDNKATILQPYRTTDSQLVLMAGLWAQPDVAMRLHDEPARGIPEKKLARFVVACKVKFLATRDNPAIRWSPRESWSKQGQAFIAKPLSCEILHDGPSA